MRVQKSHILPSSFEDDVNEGDGARVARTNLGGDFYKHPHARPSEFDDKEVKTGDYDSWKGDGYERGVETRIVGRGVVEIHGQPRHNGEGEVEASAPERVVQAGGGEAVVLPEASAGEADEGILSPEEVERAVRDAREGDVDDAGAPRGTTPNVFRRITKMVQEDEAAYAEVSLREREREWWMVGRLWMHRCMDES